MLRPRRVMLLVAMLAAVSSCSDPQLQDGDPTASAELPIEAGACPDTWKCGANSPEVDRHGFHDLNLFGVENSSGLSLVTVQGRAQILVKGKAHDLELDEGRIRARRGSNVVGGGNLIGAEIPVSLRGELLASIRIAEVRKTTFPFSPERLLEAYTLEWRLIGGEEEYRNLCSHPDALPQGNPEWVAAELLNLLPPESIVFAGDRIDAVAKTMSQFPEEGWINIGCAGHTLAKLHLTENTIAAQGAASALALWPRRQATLKLLVADYCGDGTPFTKAGVPLAWKGDATDATMSDFYFGPSRLEARWNEHGATCLDDPRLLGHDPEIFTTVRARCYLLMHSLPRCKDPDFENLGNDALRVSGNP